MTFRLQFIKRPTRDACLCMGGNQAPSAPRFVFLITLTVGGILFKFGRCMQQPWGIFFGICCSDISTNQRGHMTKMSFFVG